ncbi:MAG: translation initiation factor IF-2 [Candidatus Taylorbacteria bacterium]|nr:translation initiation factor IF-2 [Candidatus Taylorbacteria bacterium]
MPNKNQHNLVRRSPVVVVMGHIDHGKSTLLDYIRKSNIVAGEAGGITQHVGAYQAEYTGSDDKKHVITFLDTPGHEAFCSIRERGALAADIAILVVSAEDGVKPQTLEAYKEIKNAKIPYVVAINKIDKPNADINKTKQSLGENEIYVEGWGGDIPCVAISSLNGTGIPELLEMVNLIAELADLKANLSIPAEGVVIESKMNTREGISATILIKNGKLETGSFVVAGKSYTPVRYIENFKGEKIESATATMPVVIVGWNEMPVCGTAFKTVTSKKEAERLSNEAKGKLDEETLRRKFSAENFRDVARGLQASTRVSDSNLPRASDKDEPKIVSVPIVIKADVNGSLEGVKHELAKIKHNRVQLKIVSEGIGDIGENDVKLAVSDPTIIILGFNVTPDKKASSVIERSAIPLQIKTFKIIYELTEFVRTVVVSKIPKEYTEKITGRAKIVAIFSKEKDRQVVGGKVQEGELESGSFVRIMRRDTEIGKGTIRELQQQKKRVNEIREGFEFGTLIESKTEIAEGDKIEATRMIEKE